MNSFFRLMHKPANTNLQPDEGSTFTSSFSMKYDESNYSHQRPPSFRLSVDWDKIFGKETVEYRKEQHAVHYHRDKEDFLTGSSYIGQWNGLGMDGWGSYMFPHGCEYEGSFEDGRFHGTGTINYPIGQSIDCTWFKGHIIFFKFCNVDGLENTENAGYCKMPDRRFMVSKREGLLPAGRERETNQQPTRPMVANCYDIGDGFFDPSTKSALLARDPADYAGLDQRESVEVMETNGDISGVHTTVYVSDKKAEWIKANCRKGWNEPAGYRPEFYEYWMSGRHKEKEKIDKDYEDKTEKLDKSFDATIRRMTCIDNIKKVPVKYAGTGRKIMPRIY